MLLSQAEITVSTAIHEFFGISILEAIVHQTFPILPHRLSYPELIPAPFQKATLYQSQQELITKLIWAIKHRHESRATAQMLSQEVKKYEWKQCIQLYDTLFASLLN